MNAWHAFQNVYQISGSSSFDVFRCNHRNNCRCFSDCTFVQWGGKKGDRPAIQAQSGTVLIRGCEFRQDRPQITLGEGVERAIITENLFKGSERIVNQSGGNVQLGFNVSD